MQTAYVGRFAPSPTGPLHAGSLVAALASWLDARAHAGRWLVRLEDLDTARCPHGMDEVILQQLAALGLVSDEPPLRQTEREPAYQQALMKLQHGGWAFPCACSRKDIDHTLTALGLLHERHAERIYPGQCRTGLQGRPARSMRMLTERAGFPSSIHWQDRRLGPQHQDVAIEVGDFVLKRADGPWAYQLAVVVDDAHQGISDVVRGEDLADNTARQVWLQQALGLPTPRYMHVPLVLGPDGEKLSKQNGAPALNVNEPVAALRSAAEVLGLPRCDSAHLSDWLAQNVALWCARWVR